MNNMTDPEVEAYVGGRLVVRGNRYSVEGEISSIAKYTESGGRRMLSFVLKDARHQRGDAEWEPYPHKDYVAATADYIFAVGEQDLVMTSEGLGGITITLSPPS